jgi:phage shock protein PspC (stress-responsive transcriptional regulator)
LHDGDKMAEIPIAPGGSDGKLYRSRDNKVLFGVCGGIGKYFNTDPTIIRILWVLFTLIWGVGLLAYLIAILIIPEEP